MGFYSDGNLFCLDFVLTGLRSDGPNSLKLAIDRLKCERRYLVLAIYHLFCNFLEVWLMQQR